jgi:hypothetical protein
MRDQVVAGEAVGVDCAEPATEPAPGRSVQATHFLVPVEFTD